MIDARHINVHQHGTGAVGGNQAVGRTRGLNTKLHLAVDAQEMPVRMEVTAETVADCIQLEALIDGIDAEYLLADRGYDTNGVLAAAREHGMVPVIPPKRGRKEPQSYDEVLYQARQLVENCFGQLREWRSAATRYAKKVASYLAICQIWGLGTVGQSDLTTRPRWFGRRPVSGCARFRLAPE